MEYIFIRMYEITLFGVNFHYCLQLKWPGIDGLGGPMLSGTCFYIKRKALYGSGLEEKGKVYTPILYNFYANNVPDSK